MNASEILIFKSLDILQTVQKYRIFIRRQDFACTDISYLVKLLPIKSLRDYDHARTYIIELFQSPKKRNHL